MDLAIDFGTVNTLIFQRDRGIVLDEPSIAAVPIIPGSKLAELYGREARELEGRVSSELRIVRPIRSGVIADFNIAVQMLHHFLGRVITRSRRFIKPRVIAGVPSRITEVEKRALLAVLETFARDSKLIDEALAAAIGSGLPVLEPTGSMLVDIGGGTTDVAVFSMGRVVCSESLRSGGETMTAAIQDLVRRRFRLIVGPATSELLKLMIGSIHTDFDEQEMKVGGRNVETGSAGTALVRGIDVREAIEPVVSQILMVVRQVMDMVPPELLGDIALGGITLTGGGSLMKGLESRMRDEFKIPVKVADDALSAVVRGAGLVLQDRKKFGRFCF